MITTRADGKTENVLAWVEDLESGEHRQCRRYLHHVDEDGSSYCCLGRLCEIAIARGLDLATREDSVLEVGGTDEGRCVVYGACGAAYPEKGVLTWMGIEPAAGLRYAEMNDDGASFEKIAATIREDHHLPARDGALT